ncbi:MAG: hypothetical protein ACK6DQ_05335, partial [Planctomycetota bacterium]
QIKQPDGSCKLQAVGVAKSESTAWFAARVWQQPSPGRWRFAHSAPIWVDVPGKPIAPTAQERQFLIDRVEAELLRSRDVLSNEGIKEYQQALDAYQRQTTAP